MGRWLGPEILGEHDALLVITLRGQRHRFPADSRQLDAALGPGEWAASFTIPAWAEPGRQGQASLWMGHAVVPVPAPNTRPAPAASAASPPGASVSPAPPAVSPPPPAVSPPGDSASPDVDRKLAELEERLAEAQSEAASAREQLAAVSVSREAAISEAAGLRAELERLATELAVISEQFAAKGGDLGEAERLLADARALTEQLWR